MMKKTRKLHFNRDLHLTHRKHLSPMAKRIVRAIASALLGLMLSNARVIGNIRPFGIVPAAVLPAECEIFAALGCALGSLLFCDVLNALKYIAAVAVISFFRMTAQHFFERKHTAVPQLLSASCSLLVCAIAVEAARGISATGIVLCICESTLAGAGAFLLHNIVQLQENGYRATADKKTHVYILLTCGLGILSLMNIRPFGFPIACIPTGLLILVSAYCGAETGGCLAGVCIGCVAGFADDGGYTVISCCMGGLLAGICIPAGRTAAALAYLLSSMLTMITNGVTGNPFLYVTATLAAGILFILLPKKRIQKAAPLLCSFNTASAENGMRSLLCHRLQTAQNAVREFALTAAQVNARIAKMKAPREQEICHHVRSVCCSDCPRQSLCWDHSLASLRPVFLQAQKQLQTDGTLTLSTLPDRLTAVCRKPDALVGSFNDAYARFLQRNAQNKELVAVKRLASAQLQTAAGVLDDLVQNNTGGEALPSLTQSAAQLLRSADIAFDTLHAERNENERIFIHITFNQRPARKQLQKAEQLLSQKLALRFAAPVRSDEKGLQYCLYELPVFSVQCENEQHIGGNEQICGDSVCCFKDAKGNFFAVLSDGMGTGERAALDSMMTTSLAQTLLRAGISVSCTANLVNAALLLRSRQETVATLDIAKIDLYTGNVNIYKAGASFSVLHNKSRTSIIELQSLPLGILEDTDIGNCEFTMRDGDCLYLLSDGASMLSYEFFKDLPAEQHNSHENVSRIIREAKESSPGNKADDITCLRICLTRQTQNAVRKNARRVQAEPIPVYSE